MIYDDNKFRRVQWFDEAEAELIRLVNLGSDHRRIKDVLNKKFNGCGMVFTTNAVTSKIHRLRQIKKEKQHERENRDKNINSTPVNAVRSELPT